MDRGLVLKIAIVVAVIAFILIIGGVLKTVGAI